MCVSVKVKKAYCVNNIWRLQSPSEDVAAALEIALSAFRDRLPEFKREADLAREAAAFAISKSRRDMRQLENRTLRYNKNAQTLIATAGQKHSVYEPIVADFYDDHFSNDPLSTAYAAHIRSRSQRSRMTRRRLLDKTAATLAGKPGFAYNTFKIE